MLGGTEDYSDSQELTLKAIVLTTSALSIIGSASIILSYIAWEDIRFTSRKLLCWLSVCDFCTALFNGTAVLLGKSYLLENGRDPTIFCIAQSFVTTTSSIGSFLYTGAIGVYLYLSIVKDSRIAEKSVPYLHLVCLSIPLGCVSAALGFGILGYDTHITVGWCWLTDTDIDNPNLWRLFAGKLWEILAYLVTPVLYFFIRRQIARDRVKEREPLLSRAAVKEADRKLIFVPLLFVMLRIWGTTRFILDWCGVESRFELAVLQAFGDCGQGFVNCLLFCFFTSKVRAHICHSLWHPRLA